MTGAVSTVFAGEHGRDWPLPPFLLALTLVTGLIDAFSYLVLGHVFVANMTGNVVFLAFALAGAPGFSIAASLIAHSSQARRSVVGSVGRSARIAGACSRGPRRWKRACSARPPSPPWRAIRPRRSSAIC